MGRVNFWRQKLGTGPQIFLLTFFGGLFIHRGTKKRVGGVLSSFVQTMTRPNVQKIKKEAVSRKTFEKLLKILKSLGKP
jgi:hypothetical protein